ncbi:hypothetical protein Pmani_018734 [Petrolisthes manimaculis]|uniref:CLIP1 zinc knuckle domain-containing protein n=1 Tax=Petrolisthes manimaculis TaxID=1843537 RepID=A0AAE1PKC5_9EUCA|nr:hypothetical protein Pmani_018734 [Petrolisthes manimaculis]
MELKTRLEIFEMGNIPDDTKANINGSSPPGRHAVAPRMFCDICDAHETKDCPQQASDSSPLSRHHGERGATRPYCDTCEVFGHETGDCQEDETF